MKLRFSVFLLSISLLLMTAQAASVRGATPSSATLSLVQRQVLDRYLDALGAARYADAYKLLAREDQRYFGNADNFASVYLGDRIKIGKHKVLKVEAVPKRGAFVIVSERVSFYDYIHSGPVTATARVDYAVVNDNGSVRIKDPSHPWRIVVPPHATTEVDKLVVTVRKISFFSGTVEVVLSFANLGDETVTLLPYGRSVLKDQNGTVYQLVETKFSSLTDKALYEGLRLAASGQYTGALTFFSSPPQRGAVPARFTPKSLSLTVGPQLRDGADQPFTGDLAPIPIGT
jgi:hypothetical protein